MHRFAIKRLAIHCLFSALTITGAAANTSSEAHHHSNASSASAFVDDTAEVLQHTDFIYDKHQIKRDLRIVGDPSISAAFIPQFEIESRLNWKGHYANVFTFAYSVHGVKNMLIIHVLRPPGHPKNYGLSKSDGTNFSHAMAAALGFHYLGSYRTHGITVARSESKMKFNSITIFQRVNQAMLVGPDGLRYSISLDEHSQNKPLGKLDEAWFNSIVQQIATFTKARSSLIKADYQMLNTPK